MTNDFELGPAGEALIKRFELCMLEAYPDPGSPLDIERQRLGLRQREYNLVPNWVRFNGDPWTIGWGHTGPDVWPGKGCSQEEADQWFVEDVARFVRSVNELVTSPITQNQFDALVSFAYNCGATALEKSTLLKYVNQGKHRLAAGEFLKWNKRNGAVMLGLVRRRKDEFDLYLTGEGLAA